MNEGEGIRRATERKIRRWRAASDVITFGGALFVLYLVVSDVFRSNYLGAALIGGSFFVARIFGSFVGDRAGRAASRRR